MSSSEIPSGLGRERLLGAGNWWSPVMAMLKVGAMGFGGGSALIPLVGEELVDRRRVITQKAFIQHTIISSVTPGAQPVKLGALAGMQISGPWLALVMALAVSFPGTVGTLALVAGIDAGGAAVVRYVGYASVGITVFILALLLHYTIRVIQQAHSRRLAVAILVFSAVATGAGELVELIGRLFGQSWHVSLPKLSTVQLIGAALVVIVGLALVRGSKNEDHRQTEVGPKLSLWTPLIVRTSLVLLAAAVIVTFLAVLVVGFESLRFLGLVVVSALTTFGGGAAYVGVADGIFVGGEWVTSADFYGQLVPISNAMPGPILIKLAAAIGFGTAASQGPLAAWTLGVAAAVVGLAACSVVAVIVMAVFERAPNSPIVRDIGRYILPVICGLLVTTSASMLNEAAIIVGETSVSPAVVLWVALVAVWAVYEVRHRYKVHDLILIGVCGGLSLATLLLFG